MKTTINNELIRSLGACYDPSRHVKYENETLPVLEWTSKYRGTVPDEDIIWLLCHEEFLSNKDLRLFAVWCAREALSLIDNPDPRSVEACNVAERHANGEATDEELEDAYYASYDDTDAASDAYYAANSTAYYYASSAAYFAATYAADSDTTIHTSQLDKLLTYFK